MRITDTAVPDVPELVTVGHLWEYAEYYRDDRGYYGYVKIITEENPSTHVSPASKIRHHRELVTRDQAAEIIATKDAEIEQFREALREVHTMIEHDRTGKFKIVQNVINAALSEKEPS